MALALGSLVTQRDKTMISFIQAKNTFGYDWCVSSLAAFTSCFERRIFNDSVNALHGQRVLILIYCLCLNAF